MSRFRRQLCLVISFFVLIAELRADKPVWAGGNGNANSNNWKDSNGNSASAPGRSSIAHIDNGSVILDIPELGALELTTGTGGSTGTVTGNAAVTFFGGASLSSSWDAGEINFSGAGAAIFDTGATLTIGTSNSHKLSGGSITNKGSTRWTGGSIDTSNSVTINNNLGATFTAEFDG